MPLDNFCEASPVFDIPSAKFIPSICIPKTESCVLDREESLLLHVIMNTPSVDVHTLQYNNSPIKLSGQTRIKFARHLIEYLSYHIGNNIEIKSLEVLHQVFC